jgi:hypothetical protein
MFLEFEALGSSRRLGSCISFDDSWCVPATVVSAPRCGVNRGYDVMHMLFLSTRSAACGPNEPDVNLMGY